MLTATRSGSNSMFEGIDTWLETAYIPQYKVNDEWVIPIDYNEAELYRFDTFEGAKAYVADQQAYNADLDSWRIVLIAKSCTSMVLFTITTAKPAVEE